MSSRNTRNRRRIQKPPRDFVKDSTSRPVDLSRAPFDPTISPKSLYHTPTVQQKLSDAVVEVLAGSYREDHRLTDMKQYVGLFAILVTAVGHFFPLPFPQNRWILGACCALYGLASLFMFVVSSWIHTDVIFISKKHAGHYLYVSAVLPKYSSEMKIRLRMSSQQPSLLKRMSKTKCVDENLVVSIADWISEDGTVELDAIEKATYLVLSSLESKLK